ncbi:MAG TPA: HXXEE domain-containing protein [Pyrinomonadaceae bacterium]|jgi:hypothetical protein
MANEIASGSTVKIWLWLFPVVYLLHIAEEYWAGGGYVAYVARTHGVQLSPTKFLVLNAVGWALMTLGVALARRLGFTEWLLVCLATVILINGLSHTTSAVLRGEYNPGLLTGLLIFIPLGVGLLFYLSGRMRRRRYLGALTVGVLVHGVIFLLAATGGQPTKLVR